MAAGIRILVVDDDPGFADLTADFLEREVDDVETVIEHRVDDGLERLAEGAIDCVVSDYDMPETNGLEFLETVRRTRANLPFILYTGKGSEEVASEAISADVTDYLQKSAGAEQYELLANRIGNAVAQYRAERRASEQERMLTLLREINQALLQASTRAEIETAVTAILAGAEPYRLAWFGAFDAEWNRVVPGTVAGCDAESVSPTRLPESSDGAVLEAIRTGELVVTDRRDPTLEVWAEDATPIEYEAAAVLPIVYHGDHHGVLALYADRAAAVDDGERRMLEEIGGDVAQAVQAAETHRTLNRHKTAVEAVPEGVFLLDENATVELINESAASIFDRPREAVLGESFPTFVEEGVFDEEVVTWYLESLREMLSSSSPREDARYDTDVTLPSGETRAVAIHLTLRPYDEEYRGTVGIVRDVTERKRRDRELTESEERYRRLVENAPVPIALYDEDGDIIYGNDAAMTFIGGDDRDAVLGRPAIDFVHADDRELARERMRRVLVAGESAPATELSLVDLSGRRKEVIIATVPVTYEHEAAGQVVIKDITELKERERALRRQRDQLDGFASIVSHDLRNPLNVASGRLELAQEECASDHLKAVARAHGRMETLIAELLTLARQGERVCDTGPVPLTETIERTRQTIATAEAEFVTRTDRTIVADRSRLQELLENLVRNAIEHGGDDVTITVGELPGGFFVEDDGPGIPPEERERVCDAGYSTADGGTGLGLSIVTTIAEAHGWELAVTDGEDGGARFEITGCEFVDRPASE